MGEKQIADVSRGRTTQSQRVFFSLEGAVKLNVLVVFVQAELLL